MEFRVRKTLGDFVRQSLEINRIVSVQDIFVERNVQLR